MLSSRHKQSEETPLELPPRSSSTLGATPSTPATLSHAALLRSSITPQAGHMMGTALIRLRATPHTSGGLSLKPSKLPLQTHTHTLSQTLWKEVQNKNFSPPGTSIQELHLLGFRYLYSIFPSPQTKSRDSSQIQTPVPSPSEQIQNPDFLQIKV